jgi:phage terminase large subunit
MEIQATKLLRELMDNEWDVAALEGSSRSSKTYSIIQFLVIKCLKIPGITIRAFRNDGTTCGKTIVQDFIHIMRWQFKIWDSDCYNKQAKRYTFENGSVFYFDGCMDVNKLHGLKQDYAWLNEVMEITADAWEQIEYRTTIGVLMDWNPSISSHWVFSTVLTRDKGVFYAHSTYKDNPFLADRQIAAIESREPTTANIRQGTANEWAWRVYGLGERAGRKGRIYTNYRQTDHWPAPEVCIRRGYGLDFGFSNDPAALIECAIWNNELYLREIVYDTGLLVTKPVSRSSIPSIEGKMEDVGVQKTELIIADCARPDSIAELQAAGWNVAACTKGKDSVLNGIQLLQGWMLVIHHQSPHIIEELENYVWKKHAATGIPMDEPVDDYNHALDAVRYWALSNLHASMIRPASDRARNLPRHAETVFVPLY